MRESLGALLAICLAGLQFIAVLAVVFSSYLTSERVLLDHAHMLMRDVGMNTAEHSRSFLSPAQDAAELAARLSQHRVVTGDDPEGLEKLLFQQLRISSQFAGLYYGDERGNFVYVMRSHDVAPFRSKLILIQDGQRSVDFIWRDEAHNALARASDPEDQFDPRQRPWYLSVHEKMATSWTEPYIFFSSQEPGITLAAPVLDHGDRLRGVIGVDIEISDISLFLSNLRIGDNGKALIINQNGDVIAHPDPSLIKVRDADGVLDFVNIRDIDDPLARAAFDSFQRHSGFPVDRPVFSDFMQEGQKYLSYVMPVISEYIPWTIVVYIAQNDFIGAIKENRIANLWIAALVAIVTGAVGLWLANYISRPVRAFAVRSTLISQGEIDLSEPPPKTYRELEDVNDALVRQIVARKRAEREYGQTFELSGQAMAQVDPDTLAFLKVNARLCDLTGYDTARLQAMRADDLIISCDPSKDDRLGAGDLSAINREFRLRRSDGALLHVTVTSILIRDSGGKPRHAVLTLEDISLHRAREAEIARLNRDLSQLARDNTMGQMAAGLAHELNQPLTSIAQNADSGLLAVDQLSNSGAQLREILREIEAEALRAGDIIRALRAFISKDELRAVDFELDGLLDQAARLVQSEAAEANVAIHIDLPELPMVHANRVQIAQVLVNLLRNAIEAISHADSPERVISVSARLVGDQVEVDVSDTGPGLAPGIQLFRQFETSKASGMGLGLSICRSIIDANGGNLRFDSNRPKGARFLFTLMVVK